MNICPFHNIYSMIRPVAFAHNSRSLLKLVGVLLHYLLCY